MRRANSQRTLPRLTWPLEIPVLVLAHFAAWSFFEKPVEVICRSSLELLRRHMPFSIDREFQFLPPFENQFRMQLQRDA